MSSRTRIGLGCMRLSTDADRDETRGLATIQTALAAGAVVLDTAHSYGLDDADAGHNERLVATAIRAAGVDASRLRIVTKCGMRRPQGQWIPDGRASAISEHARASLEALGGLAIDVLLLHAPDPRTALATSVRALARVLDEGLVRSIGLCNVTRAQLEEARRIAPIATVQVALGAFDDDPARGGLLNFCGAHGIEVLAHSPLGGPKRAARLARDPVLRTIAKQLDASAAEVLIAYLLRVHPSIVPLVGARRVESAASAMSAGRLVLDDAALDMLDARFPALGFVRKPPAPRATSTIDREVVLMMGIPGAGKSRAAKQLAERGYERLNRDSLGGTLRDLANSLDERLAGGAERIVLDNTYVTRVARSDVLRIAARHGARVRCMFFDTPAHHAQVNVVLRMLERHGSLLEPDELARRAKKQPDLIRPTVLFRMLREFEPPAPDEGFDTVEVMPFVRAACESSRVPGVLLAIDSVADDQLVVRDDALATIAETPDGAPCLLVAWRPDADPAWRARAAALADTLAGATGRDVELAVCSHPAGPPVCWCRPPLPGLWVAFAERRGIDSQRSVLVGETPASRTMANTLGLRMHSARSCRANQTA